MSGARSQAVWVAAAAAGLEVVTGAGLVVAPSLLARLLFGSEMNASSAASQSFRTHRYGFIVCPASKGRSVAASQTAISVLISTSC